LAKRTFAARGFANGNDWSMDSLQAARLGLANDVKTTILAAIRSYQAYPSGLASFTVSQADKPYVEQSGVLAGAVSEAFAQDCDGTLRIAPAWPADWTGEGTVALKHNSKLHLQVSNGTAGTAAIESGSNTPITVRSPWPAQNVTVVDGSSGATGLRSHANGRYVTTGSAPLIASATAIGAGEQFDQLDAGNGNIALRARVNGQIVCTENAGAGALIANRTAIGPWETFTLIRNPDGSVSFRALVNNNYVTAENAGATPLIANRTAIGPWEEFDLITS
jgi:hypothetical protein